MEEVRVIRDPKAIRVATETTRRNILSLLRLRGMTVSEIASVLEKDQSTVYRHMEKLQETGLVVASGERKVHHIPEKLYTRTAKIFLISPDLTTTVEDLDLGRIYSQEEVRRMLRVLHRLGYLPEVTPNVVRAARELILHIDGAVRKELETVKVEQMELHTLWRLEMLLLLLKIREDKSLKSEVESFLQHLSRSLT